MAYDAFTAGIEPGGLRSKSEIRILICYLLTSVGAPLAREDIIGIMQNNGLANYFEVTDALSELIDHGNLLVCGEKNELLSATQQARMIARQLDAAVPISVRECAVSAALRLLAAAKREQENKVEVTKTDRGYQVTCHISGGDMELMGVSLYVPDLRQANLVKRQFHRSPEAVYQMLLAVMTGNRDMAVNVLKTFDGVFH